MRFSGSMYGQKYPPDEIWRTQAGGSHCLGEVFSQGSVQGVFPLLHLDLFVGHRALCPACRPLGVTHPTVPFLLTSAKDGSAGTELGRREIRVGTRSPSLQRQQGPGTAGLGTALAPCTVLQQGTFNQTLLQLPPLSAFCLSGGGLTFAVRILSRRHPSQTWLGRRLLRRASSLCFPFFPTQGRSLSIL